METIGSKFIPQIPIIKEAGRLLTPFNFNLCPEFFNSSGFPNLTRRIACPPLESLRESALIGKTQQEGCDQHLRFQPISSVKLPATKSPRRSLAWRSYVKKPQVSCLKGAVGVPLSVATQPICSSFDSFCPPK